MQMDIEPRELNISLGILAVVVVMHFGIENVFEELATQEQTTRAAEEQQRLADERHRQRMFRDAELVTFKQNRKQFIDKVAAADDFEAVVSAYESYEQSKIDGYERLAKSGISAERGVYAVFGAYVQENRAEFRAWMNSYVQALSTLEEIDQIDDEELLKQNEAFVQKYINRTKRYIESIDRRLPNLERRLKGLDADPEFVRIMFDATAAKSEPAYKSLQPSLNMHVQFGKILAELLELFQKNRDKWEIVDGEFSVDDETFSAEIDALGTKIQSYANRLDSAASHILKAN